ncbi:MAG: mandelate racemase [Alphaproteobacteria bacterium HGW-Alphaproteobacteria-18]|nr:MAG: mandelate racemase [Alphaproteobacteria bacterium HGW-Alphaproteobacteria-18]
MKIIEVRELSIRMSGNISNAVVDFSRHDVSLVALVSDIIRNGRPVTGIAFNSIGRFAQSGIIRDRLIPRVLNAPSESYTDMDGDLSPAALRQVMMRDEKPGGHGDRASAIAAIELAAWDLRAKISDEPAASVIARNFARVPSDKVSVYAAGGYYYPNEGANRLRDELKSYQDLGFDKFKIKVGGVSIQEDIARLETALKQAGSGRNISVDANGRFDLDGALSLGEILKPYDLRWYEEAGDPLDYDLNRQVIDAYERPVATGENLFSVPDVRNLLRHGGMRPGIDIFQMDAGLSYGLTEYAEMIALMEASGFDRNLAYPHGGHLLNLHIVAGLNLGGCEAYPAVFQPFGGYLPGLAIEQGMIRLPDTPGFGLEAKPELRPHIEKLMS